MNDRDIAIVEAAKERRQRLSSAFIHGPLETRRALTPVHTRIFIGIVVGAIAVAVCAGVSFVTNLISDREQQDTAAPAVVHLDTAASYPEAIS